MTILSSKTEMEAKPMIRMGYRVMTERIKRAETLQKRGERMGRRAPEGRGHKVGEKKGGES